MRSASDFLTAAALIALLGATPPPADAVTQQILAANDAVQLATKNHDVGTLARLVTDDYFLVSTNGHVYDRAAFLADAADTSAVYDANDTEQAHVVRYNDDSALLLGVLHIRYRYSGKLVDVRVRFTDTWVKLAGQWRYAAGQATLLKPA